MKSDVRCVMCHKPIVEIHHIIPQSENGPDKIDNAVALCARCHDIYSANPTKRKQIKEKRDSWYEMVEARKKSQIIERHYVYEKIKVVHKAEPSNESMTAIYHVVYPDEDFNDAAKALMELTKNAQDNAPNKRRILYLDIEGHRLENGAFDRDMWELQYNFITKHLSHYYTLINMPLATIQNEYEQINDPVPEKTFILNKELAPEELKKHEGSLLYTVMSEEELKEYEDNN